jgi:acetoin utilization deacetylase AcuC-like enzyme
MTTGYVWKERYAWHDTGTWAGAAPSGGPAQPYMHFESPDSKARLAGLVEVSGLGEHLTRLDVEPAAEDTLLLVHPREYVDHIKQLSASPQGGDAGDGLSPFGTGSYEIALLAVGGVIAAMDAVVAGEVSNAYALVRPPGHHARPEHGMGFCIFANSSIAIRNLLAKGEVTRVAVVDWDVHHGNGTQEVFYDDPNVLTLSIHQDRLFPWDSGLRDERGEGAGVGANINIPLPAGSGNGAYLDAIDRVVAPALRRFSPELIVISCGFDAAMTDQLGRMIVTASGYRSMTERLVALAHELCDGRLVVVHEGGYSPTYVPFCGLAVMETLSGVTTGVVDALADAWDNLPDQVLHPWQAEAILAARVSAGLDTGGFDLPGAAT